MASAFCLRWLARFRRSAMSPRIAAGPAWSLNSSLTRLSSRTWVSAAGSSSHSRSASAPVSVSRHQVCRAVVSAAGWYICQI
jgi:hypothetical protein